MWDYVALAGCFVGLALAGLFAVEYHRRTNGDWRRNPFGRFLVTRKLLLCALFTNAILNRLVDGFQQNIGEASAALLLCAFAAHTVLPYRFLLEAQHERVRANEEQDR